MNDLMSLRSVLSNSQSASNMTLQALVVEPDVSWIHLLYAVIPITLLFWAFRSEPGLYPGIPTYGVDKKTLFRISKARDNWLQNGKKVIDQGLETFSKPFQVVTGSGPKVILPNRYADEIRNEPHLDFAKAVGKEFFSTIPGFEPFQTDSTMNVVVSTVRGRLTQSLAFITEELSNESDIGIRELFGEPEDWSEIIYKPKLLDLVARVSSRIFVGPELSDNKDWLRISKDYTVDSFIAARALQTWHPVLRHVVHWFMPECKKIRAELKEARQILQPIVEQRRAENKQAREAGESVSKTADTIGWLDDAAKGEPYDIYLAQLGLGLAAIHTTTELISGLMSDLCAHPEYFEPIREEISTVIGKKGWVKSSLQELKLLDSVMKESQRHHLVGIAAMSRLATKPVTLSDGTVIPEGAMTMVSLEKMNDESVFSDPAAFNGRRFLEMRQRPGNENRWQFVSTSPEHLAFGHGKHSCPGRFFASNEVKVILIHLLMKYDWKFSDAGRRQDRIFGQERSTDPAAKALFRRRTEALPW